MLPPLGRTLQRCIEGKYFFQSDGFLQKKKKKNVARF